jgi:hypothetical protein
MHGDNTGIGVMFREPQAELFRGLMQAADMRPPIVVTTGTDADCRP